MTGAAAAAAAAGAAVAGGAVAAAGAAAAAAALGVRARSLRSDEVDVAVVVRRVTSECHAAIVLS